MSTSNELISAKAATGIEGLDDILAGGLSRGHVFLLEGEPGTGKTTAALHFLIAGAKAGERSLYITLSETEHELRQGALSHGWELDENINIFELTPPETTQTEGLAAVTVRSSDSKGFRLDVIRSAPTAGDGLQRVRWWLKGDSLYRAAAPTRDRYPLPAAKDGVVVLTGVSDLQVRVWDADKGWRQLSGNRREDPLGLEISLVRQTPQGVEKYRQVVGPLGSMN